MKAPKDNTPKRLSMNEKDAKQKKKDAFMKTKKTKENAAHLKNSNGFKAIIQRLLAQGARKSVVKSLKGKYGKLHAKFEEKINQTAKKADDLDDFGSDAERMKYLKEWWGLMDDKVGRVWEKRHAKLEEKINYTAKKVIAKIAKQKSGTDLICLE